MDQLIEIIREQIAAKGLTVKQVAERAGMGYPYLYRILKGEQSPTIASVEKIAQALDISLKITC